MICTSGAALRLLTSAWGRGQLGEEGRTDIHVHFPDSPRVGGAGSLHAELLHQHHTLLLLSDNGVFHTYLSTGGKIILSSSPRAARW